MRGKRLSSAVKAEAASKLIENKRMALVVWEVSDFYKLTVLSEDYRCGNKRKAK